MSVGALYRGAGLALQSEAAAAAGIDFASWKVFFADERCVALDHDDSNYKACAEALFGPLPFSKDNIFPIDPALPAAECAAAYQQVLMSHLLADGVGALPEGVTLDLICLGMGPDGHTASLFPNHVLSTHDGALDLEAGAGSWVAAIEDSPKPPAERVTMTRHATLPARPGSSA